jgi:phage shock protein A
MQARASAVEERQSAGTFERFTMLGSTQDGVTASLIRLGSNSAVDDELAKLKAKLGAGTEQFALPAGSRPAERSPDRLGPPAALTRRRAQAR